MNTTYRSPYTHRLSVALAICFALATPNSTSAQSANELAASALSSWIALDAPPGWEHLATDAIMKAQSGWQRDSLGNLVMRKGSGSPRRVVACGIDRPEFAVTEITAAGYLRIREAGSLRQHPLWIQFHEGQRIRVITRGGSIPGVVTVKSTHLQRGRTPNTPLTTLDDLWVDVGASSKNEIAKLGIQMLDPVVRDMPAWSYQDYVAGPAAGVRVGCAAVAAASRGQIQNGETIFLITTLRSFGNDGLAAALRSLGHIDQITLVDQPAETNSAEAVTKRKVEKPDYLPESTGLNSITILTPRARFGRSLVESIQLRDANALLAAVESAAGVNADNDGPRPWITLQARRDVAAQRVTDLFSSTADLLQTLADRYSVSGHEKPVHDAVLSALPAWARQKATTDADGNLVVEIGPDRDPVMFIAHQDEVGYEITGIAEDGTVSLRTRGGLFQSLWEGQPALLHFDGAASPPLHGVFVPRESANTKQPEATTAWFGTDGAGLKKLGVTTGLSVTADKHAVRLGTTRFTARALDDRAGSTALILAARQIDPATLKRRVILAWSVREETGLEGAIALAKRYGSAVKRVYSIDTFVSSDSPVESTRFAFAPLGQGAVIRGLDNSAVATQSEIDRIQTLASTHRIHLQIGATNGGTDGSSFVPYGAVHVSLSWPGRYSHSPVEVLDLRDLQSLVRLINVLAVDR